MKRNSGRPEEILRKKSYESLNVSLSAADEDRPDLSPPKKMFIVQHASKKGVFLRNKAQLELKKDAYSFSAQRSNSVQPRGTFAGSSKYNKANIANRLVETEMDRRIGSALRFTNRLLPNIEMGSTRETKEEVGAGPAPDKFISVVPEPQREEKVVAKAAFTK